MSSNLDSTPLSRKGDIFHYRWVAQRSFLLLSPGSFLSEIYVEGDVVTQDGDESIDAVEKYSNGVVRNVQVKYSTAKANIPAVVSDYRKTFEDFYKLYSSHKDDENFVFAIVTNRHWSDNMVSDFTRIRNGRVDGNKTWQTLKRYCKTTNEEDITAFCSRLNLIGDQPSGHEQRNIISIGVNAHFPSLADKARAAALIELVADKASETHGERTPIKKVDVLVALGVGSDDELFPARAEFDFPAEYIDSNDIHDILTQISEASAPCLLHAGAGIGKTATLLEIAKSIKKPSEVVVFDCFGGGKYRAIDGSRHEPQEAIVQINNELAYRDLCPFMLPGSFARGSDYVKKFLENLKLAVSRVRQKSNEAMIYVFVDAADNAVKAASEYSVLDECFVNLLLRISTFDGFRLVLSSRSARKDILKPIVPFKEIELRCFSVANMQRLVEKKFPDVPAILVKQITDVTQGSPRIALNLMEEAQTLSDLRANVSLGRLSIDDVFERLNNKAIAKLQLEYGEQDKTYIRRLCKMIAILPPNIPYKVLATGISKPEEFIKDYAREFGFPIWMDSEGVRFKDEPTETWFRGRYGGIITSAEREDFVNILDKLISEASDNIYAARVVPRLLHLLGDYDRLFDFVNDDDTVPADMTLEGKNELLIERYIYSMRSSLKSERFKDALQYALKSGSLFEDTNAISDFIIEHLALFAVLTPSYELATIDLIDEDENTWKGKANLYKAVLLSFVTSQKEESSILLDGAIKQMFAVIENATKKDIRKGEFVNNNERVDCSDVAAAAFGILRHGGIKACVRYLCECAQQESTRYGVTKRLVVWLEEAGFDEILTELLHESTQYVEVAIPAVVSLYKRRVDVAEEDINNLIATVFKRQVQELGNDNSGIEGYDDFVPLALACHRARMNNSDIARLLQTYYVNYRVFEPYPITRNHTANNALLEGFAIIEEMDGSIIDIDGIVSRACKRLPNLGVTEQIEIKDKINRQYPTIQREVREVLNNNLVSIDREERSKRCIAEAEKMIVTLTGEEHRHDRALEYMKMASAAIELDTNDAREYLKKSLEEVKTYDVISYWQAVQAIADRAIMPDTDKELVWKYLRAAEYTRVKAYKDKHFDRSAVFSAMDRYSPAANIALFNRWSDRNVEDFLYDFKWFAKDFKLLDVSQDKAVKILMGFGGLIPDKDNENCDGFKIKTIPEENAERYYSSHESSNAEQTIEKWAEADMEATEISSLVEYMPQSWRTKPSVKAKWKELILKLSNKIAEIGMEYETTRWLGLPDVKAFKDEVLKLMYKAIGGSQNWRGRNCYLLVMYGADLLSIEEAQDLLRTALEPILGNIPSDFGDSVCSDELFPKCSRMNAFIKMVYANLGSHDACMRWRATHVLKELIIQGGSEYVGPLIWLLQNGDVSGYIDSKYPFYKDTAKTHALVALARAARYDSRCCIPYVDVVREIVEEGQHAIQVFFGEAFLRYLGLRPSESILNSKLPILPSANLTTTGVIVEQGDLFSLTKEFIGKEVCELAGIFGLPINYVAKLITERAKQLRTLPCDGNPGADQRNIDRNDWKFSQASKIGLGYFPVVSLYGYDLSYNAMMEVALELFNNYSIVSETGNEAPWHYWLHKHGLSLNDGRWLSEICRHMASDEADELFELSYSKDPKTVIQSLARNGCIALDAQFATSRIPNRLVAFIETKIVYMNGREIPAMKQHGFDAWGIDTLDPFAGGIFLNSKRPTFDADDSEFYNDYFSSLEETHWAKGLYTTCGRISYVSKEAIRRKCDSEGCWFSITAELHCSSNGREFDIVNKDSLLVDAATIAKW